MTVINKLLSSYQSYYAAKPAQLNKIWQGIKPNKLQKLSYPADTVTISAENKVKTIKNVVKETTTPIETIDANDRIFGNVVPDAKRYKTFAKYFSHMFGKTIHVRQAKAMYEKYKQLGAINDFEEFSKKAFEQVKRDSGFEHADIPFKIREANYSTAAAWSNSTCDVSLMRNFPQKINGQQKITILQNLIHEFTHARQAAMAYRTSPEKLLDAQAENFTKDCIEAVLNQPLEKQKELAKHDNLPFEKWRNDLISLGRQKNPKYTVYDLQGNEQVFDREARKACLDRAFGKLQPFREGSKEYKQGLRYIEAFRKTPHLNIDQNTWLNNSVEKEARHNENLFSALCMWTLF